MVVEGKNSGNHEGKNRTVEGNKNMKNGTILVGSPQKVDQK
jgi:hypothetical protein